MHFRCLVRPLSWAVNLVLPPECAWCLEPVEDGLALCSSCQECLSEAASSCRRCAMPLPEVVDRSSCLRCREQNWRFDRVVALGPYRGRLREAVLLMKKPTYESLVTAAGVVLAQRLKSLQTSGETVSFDVVVPVPNHWTRRLSNRISTAETLANSIAQTLGVKLSINAARRIRRTQKQGMLAWSSRSTNVERAFSIPRPRTLAGKQVLLVDDVFTSGATAAELTRCLLKAGATRVTVAVAARGTGTRELRSEKSP